MIRFQDFSFRYQSGQTEEPAEFALQNINMEIREGEFVGITGTSGAGKSTLTYSISGLIPHHFNGDFYGSVEVNGMDTVEVHPEQLAQFVGEVFQDIDSQMVSSIVEDEILFGMENFQVPRDEIARRLEEVLNMLGIASLRRRQIRNRRSISREKAPAQILLHSRSRPPAAVRLPARPPQSLQPVQRLRLWETGWQ